MDVIIDIGGCKIVFYGIKDEISKVFYEYYMIILEVLYSKYWEKCILDFI